MGHIISFVSVKGGVGKTTLALETASTLSNEFNKRVLLVDANFSAPNVGLYLDLTNDLTLHHVLQGEGLQYAIYEAHGFDVLPASLDFYDEVDVFKLKKVLFKVKERYDFIVIDSSPNYEELKPVIAASEKVFLVSGPDEVNFRTTLKAANLAKESKTPVEGILLNRLRKGKYDLNLKYVEDESNVPVVAKVSDHKKVQEAAFYKKPVSVHDSSNSISKEIKSFVSALCGESPDSNFFQKFMPFKTLFGKEKVNRELMRQKFYREQL